jgi:hypothetical protein
MAVKDLLILSQRTYYHGRQGRPGKTHHRCHPTASHVYRCGAYFHPNLHGPCSATRLMIYNVDNMASSVNMVHIFYRHHHHHSHFVRPNISQPLAAKDQSLDGVLYHSLDGVERAHFGVSMYPGAIFLGPWSRRGWAVHSRQRVLCHCLRHQYDHDHHRLPSPTTNHSKAPDHPVQKMGTRARIHGGSIVSESATKKREASRLIRCL